MKEIHITDFATIRKHTTSTITFKIQSKVKESKKITIEQKITRKFEEIVSTITPFFQQNPEYARIFFSFLYQLSYEHHNLALQQSAKPIIEHGMKLLDKYLEEHGGYDKLKIPKGAIDLTKGDLVDKDRSIYLIQYSWYLKLYMFLKNTSLKLDSNINQEITEMISEKLVESGLTKKILNIIKGKVISSIHTRQEMWHYLERSIRKSPDVYIAQLYNYAIQYILLFMKNSYNPIGFLGDFINRQMLYIFTDVYVTEVTYHNYEDYHTHSQNLLQQAVANDILKLLYDECSNITPQTSVFLKEFVPSKFMTKVFVLPVFKKVIIGEPDFSVVNLTHNLKILYLYTTFMLKAFLKLKYIPLLLTSNTLQGTKKVSTSEAAVSRRLGELALQFSDIDLSQELKQIVLTLAQYMYINVFDKQLREFDSILFLDELKLFVQFMNSESQIKQVREILLARNFSLRQEEHEREVA